MITVSPEKNKDTKEYILKNFCNGIYNENAVLLCAKENEKLLGYALAEPCKTELNVLSYKLMENKKPSSLNNEERYIGELILRSVGNFAFNRGLIEITSSNNDFLLLAEQLNFAHDGNQLRIGLPQLFKKCKNCG